jgi:hypothetical protein
MSVCPLISFRQIIDLHLNEFCSIRHRRGFGQSNEELARYQGEESLIRVVHRVKGEVGESISHFAISFDYFSLH